MNSPSEQSEMPKLRQFILWDKEKDIDDAFEVLLVLMKAFPHISGGKSDLIDQNEGNMNIRGFNMRFKQLVLKATSMNVGHNTIHVQIGEQGGIPGIWEACVSITDRYINSDFGGTVPHEYKNSQVEQVMEYYGQEIISRLFYLGDPRDPYCNQVAHSLLEQVGYFGN